MSTAGLASVFEAAEASCQPTEFKQPLNPSRFVPTRKGFASPRPWPPEAAWKRPMGDHPASRHHPRQMREFSCPAPP